MKTILVGFLLISLGYTGYTANLSGGIKWLDNSSNPTLGKVSSRFLDVGNIGGVETYKDIFTGLYWEKNISSGTRDWADSKVLCNSKGIGWRLPTKNEIFSIMVDTPLERHTSPSYTALPSIGPFSQYWTSTEVNVFNAHYGYFTTGTLFTFSKSHNMSTICIHN